MGKLATPAVFIILLFLTACSGPSPSPEDVTGLTAEGTFLQICELLIDRRTEDAKGYYSEAYLGEFLPEIKTSFEEHTSSIRSWEKQWLTPKPMGNDYNVDVWRVKMIPDEGKGAENGPGVVYDFHIIDGKWKVVFWNHYPKTS